MYQAFWTISCFIALLALVPLGAKWLAKRRGLGPSVGAMAASQVVSVLAVGQQQRVVTVEVGPAHARTWLVLGVTPQHIQTLHTIALPAGLAASEGQSDAM